MNMPTNSQKGIAMSALITVVAFVLVAAAIFFITIAKQPPSQDNTVKDDTINENQDSGMPAEDSTVKYSGSVLAGTSAPLLDFKKADYDEALKTDKLIVLYFYANWCSICKEEFPKMQEAFDELNTDRVIAFRVNYNDNETDDAEQDLARQFGVAYQHTKVFVKNGERVLKSPESWDKNRYLSEINEFIGQ